MLSNAYLLAKIRSDTAETEPCKICKILLICAHPPGPGLALGDLEQRAPPSVELLLRRERFREQDDLPKWRSVPPPFTAKRAGSFSRRKSGTTSRLPVVIDTNGFVVEIAHEQLVLRTLDR